MKLSNTNNLEANKNELKYDILSYLKSIANAFEIEKISFLSVNV